MLQVVRNCAVLVEAADVFDIVAPHTQGLDSTVIGTMPCHAKLVADIEFLGCTQCFALVCHMDKVVRIDQPVQVAVGTLEAEVLALQEQHLADIVLVGVDMQVAD